MPNVDFVFADEAETLFNVEKGDKKASISPGILSMQYNAAMFSQAGDSRRDAGQAAVDAAETTMSWIERTYGIRLSHAEFQQMHTAAERYIYELKKSSPPTSPSSSPTELIPSEPDSVA